MRFWIREIAGWLLVVLGLFIFYMCFLAIFADPDRPLIISGSVFIFVGFVVFRGGIHLLKVAMAARVFADARAVTSRKKGAKSVAPVTTE